MAQLERSRDAQLADDRVRSASELVGSRVAAALEGCEDGPLVEFRRCTPVDAHGVTTRL